MHSLPAALQLSRQVWLAIGIGVVAEIILVWVVMRFGRRRQVVLGRSQTTEIIAYQLERIADALDRKTIAPVVREPQGAPEAQSMRDMPVRQEERRQAARDLSALSIFGR
jgi:hypothetical protein